MASLLLVADGLRYPRPGSAVALRAGLAAQPHHEAHSDLDRFVSAVEVLELAEWEELHTRTIDLSPLFVPYVGHVTWGENYRRGAFMADLQAAQRQHAVDQEGELPDHLIPVLRLLASGAPPPADLVEVLPAAITRMRRDLKKAEADNPYRHLLAAIDVTVDAHLSEGAHP